MHQIWRVEAKLLNAECTKSIMSIKASNKISAIEEVKFYLKNKYPNSIIIITSVQRIEE